MTHLATLSVVTFTRDSYTIEEDGDPVLIHVCAHVLFPTFSLFTRNMITLILYATTNTSGSKDGKDVHYFILSC